MGDPRRFDLFAKLVAKHFEPSHSIADVAGGKGMLQLALREQGFSRVITWDTRQRYFHSKCHKYRHQRFDYRNAPRDYTLCVGMHPDEATDHIVAYSLKHRVPFVICPCCVKPSAWVYHGNYASAQWRAHLQQKAEEQAFQILIEDLRMNGRNVVLIGKPQ